MRLVSYSNNGHINVGVVQDDRVFDITEQYPDVMSIVYEGDSAIEKIQSSLHSNLHSVKLNEDILLSPLPKINRNIICIWLELSRAF